MELLGWFRKIFTSGVSVPDALKYTPRARRVLDMAVEAAKRENREKPSVGDVAVALAE